MTYFEAPDSFAASKDQFCGDAASQCARDAWSRDAMRRAGELDADRPLPGKEGRFQANIRAEIAFARFPGRH